MRARRWGALLALGMILMLSVVGLLCVTDTAQADTNLNRVVDHWQSVRRAAIATGNIRIFETADTQYWFYRHLRAVEWERARHDRAVAWEIAKYDKQAAKNYSWAMQKWTVVSIRADKAKDYETRDLAITLYNKYRALRAIQWEEWDNRTRASRGAAVVKTAIRHLGIPYVWGGESERGMNCSGFVVHVFRETYKLNLPHYTRWLWARGKPISRANLKPGDAVFFYPQHSPPGPGHVAIYVRPGVMIDAPHRGAHIEFGPIHWRGYVGARRYW